MNRLALIIATLSLLSSCSKRIDAPQLAGNAKVSARANYSQGATEADFQAEGDISQRCVEAWRKAIAGDPDGAIRQLKELERKYPKVSTVQFMIGQVLERSGKRKEAVPYYKDAVREFEFSSIYLYKLAEAMRTTGDAQGSIVYYRKLIKMSPDFAAGRLGLAKALRQIDSGSKEAKEQINVALQAEPENAEAKAMLQGISSKSEK